jgi:hypothetical protein
MSLAEASALNGVCCPSCEQPMETGWLAIYEPLPITRLVWQNKKPGWVRVRMPQGSRKVIQPKVGGAGCPVSYICKTCEIVTFSYNRSNTT